MGAVRESAELLSHLASFEARGEAELLRAALIELLEGGAGAGAEVHALIDLSADPNLASIIERLARIVEKWRIERLASDARAGLVLARTWQRLAAALVREHQRRVHEGLRRLTRSATFGHAAAGLLHDMNNRFAWLVADVQLARRALGDARTTDKTGSGTPSEIDQVLARIEDGVFHLTRQIRAASGLHAADSAASLFDLREVIEVAVAAAAPVVKVNVRLRAEVPTGLRLSARRHDLERAVASILIALGQSREQFAEMVVTARRRENWAVIEVMGAPEPRSAWVEEQLFQPFGVSADEDGGLGLCLFVGQEIIREHGGHIVLPAEPGREEDDGDDRSLMTIELPLG